MGVRHWGVCHSILLFNTAENVLLLLAPYEEGQIVSWSVRILNTANQNEVTETNFAVEKEKK